MKADEFHRVSDRVLFWEAYDPAVKTNLSSTAVQLPAGVVYIDPIPLARDTWAELEAAAPPAMIVLTNGNHARAAEQFRQRLGVPVLAHAEAVPELGLAPDRLLRDADLVLDDLRVHELPGAAAGEIALHSQATGLHFGDAVINAPPYGFAPLPAKYCRDVKAMRAALRRLGALEFPLITSAHGMPLVTAARRRYAELLHSFD